MIQEAQISPPPLIHYVECVPHIFPFGVPCVGFLVLLLEASGGKPMKTIAGKHSHTKASWAARRSRRSGVESLYIALCMTDHLSGPIQKPSAFKRTSYQSYLMSLRNQTPNLLLKHEPVRLFASIESQVPYNQGKRRSARSKGVKSK